MKNTLDRFGSIKTHLADFGKKLEQIDLPCFDEMAR